MYIVLFSLLAFLLTAFADFSTTEAALTLLIGVSLEIASELRQIRAKL